VCPLFPRHTNYAYDLSIIARMGDQAYNLNCQIVWLLTSTLNRFDILKHDTHCLDDLKIHKSVVLRYQTSESIE